MNYGNRQGRAELLVKALKESEVKGPYYMHFPTGRGFTALELAAEVEEETNIGKDLVASAGLTIEALKGRKASFS